MAKCLRSPGARAVCGGFCASAGLHLALMGVLLVEAIWPFLQLFSQPVVRIPNQVVLEARAARPDEKPLDDAIAEQPVVVQSEPAGLSPTEAARNPDEVFGSRVASKLEQAIVAAQQQPKEEQQEQLGQLAGQLAKVSSEKTVDEMAGKLSGWLGTQKRAGKPAEKPVAGEFDLSTAQLHDVRREPLAEGGFLYMAILVDAKGRRSESRMDETEGESAYKTMQLLKANPLAEMVYRRIVMGFLDNIIKAQQKVEEAQQALPAPDAAKPQADGKP